MSYNYISNKMTCFRLTANRITILVDLNDTLTITFYSLFDSCLQNLSHYSVSFESEAGP